MRAITEFCNEMRQSKVWGGEESIMAVGKAFGLTMVVFDLELGSVLQFPNDLKPELYVQYVDGNHYQFMEPPKRRVCYDLRE